MPQTHQVARQGLDGVYGFAGDMDHVLYLSVHPSIHLHKSLLREGMDARDAGGAVGGGA